MSQVAPQTLEIIGKELDATLSEARAALEAFGEQPENLSLLERTAAELRRVQGVLRVLEIYGAALLAEEMEQVARYLIENANARRNQAECLDALLRAMVQLPGYLERVLAGGRDVALVLLPLLNDLRAVRGSPLLSEGTLLLLNLKSDEKPPGAAAMPSTAASDNEPAAARHWARRLRSQFQLGLVGWIRGEGKTDNLSTLQQVAEQIERAASEQSLFQLWWVVGAVIEALRDEGLEDSVSVKRLLGLADRELKRLYEQGELRYAQNPPVDLLNNLLYYVARATSRGPRIVSVRKSFRLDELLPVDAEIEEERETLSAPSIKLMQTVASAIREDLGKIKDVLDIFVRRRTGQAAELAPQVELLRKIGDTLGVLGLGELRAAIQGETARLDDIVAGRAEASEPVLVDIASTIISVEDRLDAHLIGMIVPKRAADGEGAGEAAGEPVREEFLQVQAAVLRECRVNLARIKEAISQNVGGTIDAAALDAWPELMRGIKAGLLMLGRTRAVAIAQQVHDSLKRVMQPGGAPLPPTYLDRLADAIVSLEYYMETLEGGRAEPAYMLDNAQTCLEALLRLPDTPAPPVVGTFAPAQYARTVVLEPRGDAAGAGPAMGQPPPVLSDAHAATAPPVLTASGTEVLGQSAIRRLSVPVPVPPPAAPAVEIDADLRDVFIEEAHEELARIQQHYPEWERNPTDHESLRTLRRSFHTLKGSGRMVGATELAEFAWSVENLMNRVLDGTLERTAPIAGTLREAVAVVPQLVRHLEGGPAPTFDVAALVSRAHALAAGKDRFPVEPVAEDPAPPAPEPVRPEAAAPAPVVATPVPDTAPHPQIDLAATAPVDEPSIVVDTMAIAREAAAGEFVDLPLEAESGAGEIEVHEYPLSAGSPPVTPTLDDSLQQIYLRETDAHVATVRAFIELERRRPPLHRLSEPVYRACHTLSGSSKMAEARHGVRLAEPLDRWLRKSFVSGVGLGDADLDLLDDCMGAMQQVARHLGESTLFFVGHDVLRARLMAAESDLDQRIAEVAEGEGEHVEIATLVESEPRAPTSPFAALQEPEPETDASPPVAEPVMPETAVELDADVEFASFDPEIASVFTEEASELLDEAQAALNEWSLDRSDMLRATALKRPLHTLKGGARLAGIRAMGDLSHEIETAIGQVELGLMPSDAATHGLLQAGLDELARMRDGVAAGRAPAPARELIRALRGGKATPAGAALHAGAAEPATPKAPIAALPATPPQATAVPTSDAAPEPPAVAARTDERTIADTGTRRQPVLDVAAYERGAGERVEPVPAEALSNLEGTAIMAAPAILPPGREPAQPAERAEMARVDPELLDTLLNNAGEVSIGRARLEQQVGSIDHHLGELSRTVTRLKEQLRNLEIETEKQILHRYDNDAVRRTDFDPLELDRYSAIQQLSRALGETASDVGSIQQLLETLTQDTQNLLQQQARIVTELQNGLMRTRMVPFQRHVPRLARIVRQTASDTGKRAELAIEGVAGELDRQVLERMLPPFEHILRNAVVHGIETPEIRRERGKSEQGTISMSLQREGSEVVVTIADDGGGMNLAAIRAKAVQQGLIGADQPVSEAEAMQLVLEPGFSTASSLTQHAGRGVGMDVVATEVKKLGGSLQMQTREAQGTRFVIRLPFTLAISHALVVRVEDEYYALPMPTVEGVVRLSREEVQSHLAGDQASFEYASARYRLMQLGTLVGLPPSTLPEQDVTIPVVLIRAGDAATGLVADELIGSREIVVKSVGPQIAAIRGISGATILGDGRIVIILDVAALLRADRRSRAPSTVAPVRDRTDSRPVALVVDDSITVRRVTQRLLERNGMRVLTARDGLDAIGVLADSMPDIILLDIEMPRMDGYEFATQVRNDERTRGIPIIMITSRVGEKHRARAIEIGVDDYLGKPYQESQLLEAIEPLISRRREMLATAGGGARRN